MSFATSFCLFLDDRTVLASKYLYQSTNFLEDPYLLGSLGCTSYLHYNVLVDKLM